MILAISKIFYKAVFSTSEYFKRYGGQGTRGRRGLIQPARGVGINKLTDILLKMILITIINEIK